MKKSYWITLITGLVITLGIYAVPSMAQQAAAQAQPAQLPYRVAVVDVAQLIKLHPIFIDRQAALQEQVKQAEATFQTRQQAIAAKQKNLETAQLKAGTPEHQKFLDEIANDLAEFEKDAKTQQRKFALENSKIMYDTYQDIKASIQKYAASRLIAQVTDYREFEPNPADPQTVAEDMDQRLVWYDDRLNITKFVATEIYAKYPGRAMPTQTAAGAPAGVAGAAAPRTAAAPATAAPAGAAPAYGTPMQQR